MYQQLFFLLFFGSLSLVSHAQTFEFKTLDINSQGYATLEFIGPPSKKGYKETLIVENTGDKDLVITATEGGCHCTKARVLKKRIKPNQSTKLLIHWSPNPDTEFSTSLSIKSNDPKFPEIWLQVLGNLDFK